jgi:hypothetical protein
LRAGPPAMNGAGPFQPNAPHSLKPKARYGREGTHHGGGVFPSVAQGRPSIVANTIRPPTALTLATIHDDLHAADLLEGGLDFGKKERAIGRHHGVIRPDPEPLSGAGWADPVGHHRVRGIPVG